MQTTIQKLEASRHAEAVEMYMSRHFDPVWLAEIERQALIKHPPRQRAIAATQPPGPEPSPFIQGQPVSPSVRELAVEIAKQQLPQPEIKPEPTREPKRTRKTLP